MNFFGNFSFCVLLVMCWFKLHHSYQWHHSISPSFRCRNGDSIPLSFKCDDDYDCLDQSDEGDICECKSPDTFNCSSFVKDCIYKSQACDGLPDCENGVDERNCGPCLGFKCRNDKCIESKGFCNGRDDCGDNSDETNCKNCTLPNGKFMCRDMSKCLTFAEVCNDIVDCDDGSDETEGCRLSCAAQCENAKCARLPSGPICQCNKGFEYSDRGQCQDINECKEEDVCPQECVNTVGSFKCTCWEGYQNTPTNATCVPAEPLTSTLFYSTATAIWKYDIVTREESLVADNLTEVNAISADSKYVYWSEGGQEPKILRKEITTNTVEVVGLRTVGSADGIAVDWWTGNVYYTDIGRKAIVVLGDARHKSVAIVTKDLERPRGIALYPKEGKMFWSDWGRKPYIGVASMDGREQHSLVTENLHWPNGLSIDPFRKRLYWVDSYKGTLGSVTLDGPNRKDVTMDDSPMAPLHLQVLYGTVYWTARKKPSLYSSDPLGVDKKVVLTKDGIWSLAVDHSLLQRNPEHGNNPCQRSPCPYMCLLTSKGQRSCVDGNTKSVVAGDQYKTPLRLEILLGYKQNLFRVDFGKGSDPEVHNFHHIHFGNYTVSRLVHDTSNGDFYVADNEQRKILKVVPHNVKEVVEFESRDIGKVSAMQLRGNNLFWTDSERRTLEVMSLATKYRKTIHRFTRDYTPLALLLRPKEGDVFVVTRNGTALIMIQITQLRKATFPLRATIGESESVTVTVTGDEGTLFLAIGGRLITWDFKRNQEREVNDYFVPRAQEMIYRRETGEFFWTGKGETLNWANGGLMRLPSKLNDSSGRVPVDIPIIEYSASIRVESEETEDGNEFYNPMMMMPKCHVDNGKCSDICVTLNRDDMPLGLKCICGNGRIKNLMDPRECTNSSVCAFTCDNDLCLAPDQICDGLSSCEDGMDEANCTNAGLLSQLGFPYMNEQFIPPGGYQPPRAIQPPISTDSKSGGGVNTILAVALAVTVTGFLCFVFRKTIREAFTKQQQNGLSNESRSESNFVLTHEDNSYNRSDGF